MKKLLLGFCISVFFCSNSMAGVTTLKTGSVRGDYEVHFTADVSGIETVSQGKQLKLLVFGSANGRPAGDQRPDWWDGLCTMDGQVLTRNTERVTSYIVNIPPLEQSNSKKIVCNLHGTIGGIMQNPRIAIAVDTIASGAIFDQGPGWSGLKVYGTANKVGDAPQSFVPNSDSKQYVVTIGQPDKIREFNIEYADSVTLMAKQEKPVQILKTTDTVLASYASSLPLKVTRFENSSDIMTQGISTGVRELWVRPNTTNNVGRTDGTMTITITSK